LASWLAAQHLPVTEPAAIPSGTDQPIVIDGRGEVAVTFWRYYPQPARSPAPDTETLARIARALHDIRSPSPIPLPSYKPLRSIKRAVNDSAAAGMPGEQHIGRLLQWLAQRIVELLSEYQTLSFPLGTGLIPADMHTGNLLLSSGEYPAVLGDWDSVCVGPREIDLAPAFSAPRFGLDHRSVDQFVVAYGYDLREWPGYPTLRAMRELSTLTALVRLAPTEPAAARKLEHRLSSLWRGDTTAVWTRQ
jgi:aminoglycoside phosphotransferase (APT) family kinase protein